MMGPVYPDFAPPEQQARMVNATSLKRLAVISAAVALIGLMADEARAQDPAPTPDLTRANQDELASFYGRMNVVVGSGARAFGMGGAFLAQADDATAASWNPAGLSYLRRAEFSLVGVHNDFSQRIPRINTSATPASFITTRDQLRGSVADFAAFVYPVRVKGRPGAIQVSYQRSFSFEGKRTSEATIGKTGFLPNGGVLLDTEFTVDGNGGFDTLSVSSGFEIRSNLRAGVTINRWINGFSQSVDRRPNRRIDSTWDISGTNFNFGLLFAPVPRLNLGAVLKTQFTADIKLSKTRTDLVAKPADPNTGIVPESGKIETTGVGDARIRFPRVYGFGLSYRATNTITLSTDFTRTEWSKATIANFFSLAIGSVDDYGTLPFPAVEEGAGGQANTNQVRAGAEWVLRLGEAGNVLLPLRAGIFRDGQPVVKRLSAGVGAPIINYQPAFTGVTGGMGITVGGVLFDLAYIREAGRVPISRGGTRVYDGNISVKYNRVFVSMMVRFGPRR